MNMDKEIEASLREFLVDIGCSHANDTRTGGKTDNWKIAIYERDGLQVAFYDKKQTIHLILEHYDDIIPNVRRNPRAEGSQRIKPSLNIHVEVHTLKEALTILKHYYNAKTHVTTFENHNAKHENAVINSRKDSSINRQARLAHAPKKPKKRTVTITVFDRNPDVIAEVLERANGTCEGCNEPAPFIRARDGTPYLEVHHKDPLAQDGEDTVEKAIALCPNCHREAHFGSNPANSIHRLTTGN